MLYGKENVCQLKDGETYENKFVVFYAEALSEGYRDAKYQLFYAKSGFGCDPSKMGNAVFGTFCFDGENTRMERYHIMGVATDDTIKHFTENYHEPITA